MEEMLRHGRCGLIIARLGTGEQGGRKFRWNTAASLGAVFVLAMVASSAHAQEASKTFHISAQPLANALIMFSEQSGLAVMAPADLVRGKAAPAVEGSMPPLMALARLLNGSGLTYYRSADGALTIVPAGSTKANKTPAAPRAGPLPNPRIADGLSGKGSETRQIPQTTLARHFCSAVIPGSAASLGPPFGRAPASGGHC